MELESNIENTVVENNDTNVSVSQSPYILEIKTVQSAAFRILIEALKEILTDANMEFDSSGLKVIAINFPSHRILPFADNISFFDENDQESFIRAIQNSFTLEPINKKDLVNITMESRINKIISLINK